MQESGSEGSNNEEKIEYNEDETEKKRSKTEPVRNAKNNVVKTEDCTPGPSLPLESRIIDESGSDDPPGTRFVNYSTRLLELTILV